MPAILSSVLEIIFQVGVLLGRSKFLRVVESLPRARLKNLPNLQSLLVPIAISTPEPNSAD